MQFHIEAKSDAILLQCVDPEKLFSSTLRVSVSFSLDLSLPQTSEIHTDTDIQYVVL